MVASTLYVVSGVNEVGHFFKDSPNSISVKQVLSASVVLEHAFEVLDEDQVFNVLGSRPVPRILFYLRLCFFFKLFRGQV